MDKQLRSSVLPFKMVYDASSRGVLRNIVSFSLKDMVSHYGAYQ